MNALSLYKILLTLLILGLRLNTFACDTLCVVYNENNKKFEIDTVNGKWCNQNKLGIYADYFDKLTLPEILPQSNINGNTYLTIKGTGIKILRGISNEFNQEIINCYTNNDFCFDSVFIKIRIPILTSKPLNSIENIYNHYGISLNDSIDTEILAKTNINYFAYTITDNYLYVINDSGNVVIWDINKYDTIRFLDADTSFRFTCITKNKQNEIFLGTDEGEIYKFTHGSFDLQKFLTLKKKYYIHDIFFNSRNEMFLIIPWVVYDPIKDKYWNKFIHPPTGMLYRKKVLFFFKKETNKYCFLPDYTYIDKEDKIWMIKNEGEWGGDIQLFDTKKKKCLKLKYDSLELNPFQSVFEDNDKNIYLSSGIQHMSSSGCIDKIDSNHHVIRIFDSEDYATPWGDELFIGPGTFNKFDSCIYFASSFGFFKTNLKLLENHIMPAHLFSPLLTWSYGNMACGYAMPVKRMEFISDNKLIFLTTNNGIGIYDGKKLVFLK
jgi:hypothetical protein